MNFCSMVPMFCIPLKYLLISLLWLSKGSRIDELELRRGHRLCRSLPYGATLEIYD